MSDPEPQLPICRRCGETRPADGFIECSVCAKDVAPLGDSKRRVTVVLKSGPGNSDTSLEEHRRQLRSKTAFETARSVIGLGCGFCAVVVLFGTSVEFMNRLASNTDASAVSTIGLLAFAGMVELGICAFYLISGVLFDAADALLDISKKLK